MEFCGLHERLFVEEILCNVSVTMTSDVNKSVVDVQDSNR